MKERENILQVEYNMDLNLLMVVAGEEGVDCYEVDRNNKKLNWKYTIEV